MEVASRIPRYKEFLNAPKYKSPTMGEFMYPPCIDSSNSDPSNTVLANTVPTNMDVNGESAADQSAVQSAVQSADQSANQLATDYYPTYNNVLYEPEYQEMVFAYDGDDSSLLNYNTPNYQAPVKFTNPAYHALPYTYNKSYNESYNKSHNPYDPDPTYLGNLHHTKYFHEQYYGTDVTPMQGALPQQEPPQQGTPQQESLQEPPQQEPPQFARPHLSTKRSFDQSLVTKYKIKKQQTKRWTNAQIKRDRSKSTTVTFEDEMKIIPMVRSKTDSKPIRKLSVTIETDPKEPPIYRKKVNMETINNHISPILYQGNHADVFKYLIQHNCNFINMQIKRTNPVEASIFIGTVTFHGTLANAFEKLIYKYQDYKAAYYVQYDNLHKNRYFSFGNITYKIQIIPRR